MYLPDHGSPVETSPSESVRECLAFSLLAPSSWRLKCPVPAGRLSWAGGTCRGHCSALAFIHRLTRSPEKLRAPAGAVRKSSFLMFPLTRDRLSSAASTPPSVSSLKPTGTRQKWGFRNLTPNGLELGLVWDNPACPREKGVRIALSLSPFQSSEESEAFLPSPSCEHRGRLLRPLRCLGRLQCGGSPAHPGRPFSPSLLSSVSVFNICFPRDCKAPWSAVPHTPWDV